MPRIKRVFALLCILFIFTSFFGCGAKKTQEAKFHDFLDEMFLDEASSDSLSLHYLLVHPENFGVETFDTTLGDFSATKIRKDMVKAENALAKLERFNLEELSKENQTTYKILEESLRNTLKLGENPYLWEVLGPSTGLQAQLPILLAEYAFYEKDDILRYLELLDCVDDYFNQICKFQIDKSKHGYFMTDVVADAIIIQCQDFIQETESNFLITYFNDKLESFPGLTLEEKVLFQEKNYNAIHNSVIPAYESLIQTLSSLKNTSTNQHGLSGFIGGKEYYEYKVQANTGSSKTVPEMKAALKSALDQCFAMLTKLSVQDPSLYSQYQAMKFPYEDPNEIMEYLILAMDEDFPSINSVDYSVKYVHKSLQKHLSPAMYLTPPIDDFSSNYIYINNFASYDMTKIFPTIAHEGYPGHLYQNIYLRQLDLHPIRSVINVTGYDEGWATYVECYSYELAKLNPNLARFLQANMIAIHCLYSLTDIGIHYEGWTKEDTINFWLNYVPTIQDAEDIYYSVLSEPGVYLPYSIGYLEIIHLRELARKYYGNNFNIKQFHQFLLDFGPAPFHIIEERLLEKVNE